MLEVSIKKRLWQYNINLDFSFDQGVLVVFGPSGAGKTTLLQCIAGLQQPDQGIIRLDGKLFYSSAGNINLPTCQRKIGYVFQDYALFPHLTVKKNILYGAPKGRDPQELMEKLKISHLEKRYPRQLSGGEQQRVALARTLITEPDLILLDEPLSALDEKTRRQLQVELLEIQSSWQIPFILVTHSKQEARLLGNEILYLGQGKRFQLLKSGEVLNYEATLHCGHHPEGR